MEPADLDALKKAIHAQVLFTKQERTIVAQNGLEMAWVFDFRAALLEPSFLDALTEALWQKLEPFYPFQLGGQETAAIPLVAGLVMKSVSKGKPVNGFYIRKSRKRYDLQQQVEGSLTDAPVILVDDLLNSGSTIQRQVLLLKELGKQVVAVQTIVRFRNESDYSFLTKQSIALHALFTLADFGLTLNAPHERLPSPKEWYDILWYGQSPKPTFTYSVPKSTPILDTERLYFGTDNGGFISLRQSDGTQVWQFSVGRGSRGKSIFSSPAIWNKRVYFGSYDGNMYALDTETGSLVWKYTEADWIGSSPVLAPDLNALFIGLEFGLLRKHGGIAALDMQTGKERWTYTTPGLVHASPGYSKKHRVVGIGSNNNVFYLFEAKTGALHWSRDCGSEIKYSCVFDDVRGLVFFGSLDGTLWGLDVKTGATRFTYQTGGIYSTPLLGRDNKTIYTNSLDKSVYAIDIETGTLRWRQETSGRIFSSPVYVEDSIYVGSNDGRLYELDPETGKILTFFQATEKLVNSPAYNQQTRRLFLPTFANEVYCLQKRTK